MATMTERELLQALYTLLRRMEACPSHGIPKSDTGVVMHHHYDPSRIGTPDSVEKKCTEHNTEAQETEYARLMRRVKTLLSSAPS